MHRLPLSIVRCTSFIAMSIAIAFFALTATPSFGQNRVELEILVGKDVSIEKRQEWMQLLSRAGADSVRMRSANPGDKIRVTATPRGDSEVCKLVAQLTRQNKLAMPGGTFSKRDLVSIRSVIQKIRDDGAEVALSEKKAFGLTSRQLVYIHKQFGEVYSATTRGIGASEIVSAISQKVKTPIELTADAKAALAEDYQIDDELSGLSLGTVLAATLRPLGLVAVPQHPQGGETRIVLTTSDQADEHWPIGWPYEGMQRHAAPKLWDKFSIRAEGNGLRDVLDAIEKRSAVNFVYDYNSLAEKGIELNEAAVAISEKKSPYIMVVNKLLSQSKLGVKAEVRVDEAGKAFVWISTSR